MPDTLQRGAVVSCGRRFSVVWQVTGDRLVLLPIIVPRWRGTRRPWAYDVPLDLADLVAGAVPIAGAVVRPKVGLPVPRAGHAVTGTLPGPTMCRVVHQLLRGEAEAAAHAKWQGDRAREHERCANLVR